MNLESLARAKGLLQTSQKLEGIIPAYVKKASDSSCDKHSLIFGGDDRFAVFKTTVFLDCHIGYYGNSSCSTLCSIPQDDAKKLLNKALNKHMKLILDTMAQYAKDEALALKGKAEEELAKAAQLISELGSEAEKEGGEG